MSQPSNFRHLPRLLHSQPFRWLLGSIKGQIFILFMVTFISASVLTLMDFRDLSMLKRHLVLEDRYHDILDNVLEVRRYEKNYLLYKDSANLQEGKRYLEKIDPLVMSLSEDMIYLTDRKTFEQFHGVLVDYAKTHQLYLTKGETSGDGEVMRRQGRDLTNFATKFLRVKQQKTQKAIENVLLLPFAFLGVFFLLMLLVIWLVSLGLLRPLKGLQRTIRDVATGNYNPGGYQGFRTEEMSELVDAFDQMAKELAVNQEHLLQARKMAALGTFTAGIAHELNNPLNNISLTAETYLEEYGERMDEGGRELIGDVLSQSERACDIVKNLLDFSRTQQRVRTSIDPREIIAGTVALVKNHAALAGVKFDVRIPEVSRPVRGSMRSLQQVFTNLFSNAVQAMPEGGTITVEVVDESPGFVRFDIRDTGMGIAPETVEHIFEPFFTTKDAGQGTGLGLSVVYAIVKRHGGRLEVNSEIGKGTVFSVFLQAAESEEQPAASEQERSQNAVRAGGNS
ncbi:MAG: HAMP domain-containing sensor histidine kinase [Syntrophobacteraceae bacterium]|nr:HAMP domain-containing sensor histidine kinase [Syntrophobacteraceae bacterium]